MEGRNMTRQDIMKIFPNATEEQIGTLLGAHHSELQQEKDKAKGLKDTSKELEEAQKEIEALRVKAESGAPEDWQSQIDKLTEANAKAQKTIKNMELKNSLKEKGFSDADADRFIKTIDEGGDIATVMGEMKTNIISAYDKERMDKTPEASGGKLDEIKEKEKADEALAKNIAESIGHNSKTSSDIVDAYI